MQGTGCLWFYRSCFWSFTLLFLVYYITFFAFHCLFYTAIHTSPFMNAFIHNRVQINWTVLYRRKHRKGMVEEAAKKRTRRTQKFMRAVTGATLADIMAKRNQKPEVRQAQR